MAVIPAGKPTGVPIPIAPVVTCVIFVKVVCLHKVGVEEATLTVLFGEIKNNLLAVARQPLLSVTVTM